MYYIHFIDGTEISGHCPGNTLNLKVYAQVVKIQADGDELEFICSKTNLPDYHKRVVSWYGVDAQKAFICLVIDQDIEQ